MVPRRAVTALFLVQLLALAALAQESSEFGRGTGGVVTLTPKGAAPLSGSLEISLSSGSDVFGSGTAPAVGLAAGGVLLQDRLWFFAGGSRQESPAPRFANNLPENATTGAIGARVNGRIAGGHDLSAFFEAARRPEFSAAAPSLTGIAPASFLSLRYTGIVTDNMFFTASLSRSSGRTQGAGVFQVE